MAAGESLGSVNVVGRNEIDLKKKVAIFLLAPEWGPEWGCCEYSVLPCWWLLTA
jgi:hypothetical protein